MSRRPHRSSGLSSSDVPALAAFARGYLHQDARLEYGDWPGAAAGFSADASTHDRLALVSDLERLLTSATGWSDARLTRFFRDDLGAAWPPASVEDLETILALLVADGPDA